jgi:hypothetical protein|tara:strand:+ start:4197 stop:4496 length:300 start_codon:yes stop_codon:yes gene_type:complete
MYRTLNYMGSNLREISEVTNGIMNGKTNNTGSVTLRASNTTTTITDERLGFDSIILLSPLSANAAAQTPYISTKAKGSVVITHTSTAHTDLNFDYIIVG